MNDDYLWDKSGEADPDIERLEQKLAGLRFKRTNEPLPLPATERRFFHLGFNAPALAIAATLIVLLLAGGLWLGLHRTAPTADENKVASGPRPPVGPDTTTQAKDTRTGTTQAGNATTTIASPAPVVRRERAARRYQGSPRLMAQRRAPRVSPGQEELARQQGEQAKAQLIRALHLASDKLNAVQKKIQGNQDRGPIS
jgi:hypothetical protein